MLSHTSAISPILISLFRILLCDFPINAFWMLRLQTSATMPTNFPFLKTIIWRTNIVHFHEGFFIPLKWLFLCIYSACMHVCAAHTCVWCLRPKASYLVSWNRIIGSLWAATWVESSIPNLSSPPLFPCEVCPFSVVYKNHQIQSYQDVIWCLLTFMALASIPNHMITLLGKTVWSEPHIIYQVVPRLRCKYKTQIKDEGGVLHLLLSTELCCTGFPNHTNKNLYMPISKVSLKQETDWKLINEQTIYLSATRIDRKAWM